MTGPAKGPGPNASSRMWAFAALRVLNCHGVATPYESNGYEDVAAEFIAGRGRNSSGVGASAVANWSQTLASGATVLDLGCGTGVPISQALIERGFKVYGWTPHPRSWQRSGPVFQAFPWSVPL
jgi:hypothetical protein